MVPVYSDREFEMKIIFPEVDFKLWIELNTNVEGIIFMGFKDVFVDAGTGFTFNGSSSPNFFSSGYFSTIKDRVVIDLGYLQVSHFDLLFTLILFTWIVSQPKKCFTIKPIKRIYLSYLSLNV